MAKVQLPFTTREETFEVYARHVSRGKVETYRGFGLDTIMGERGESSFADAYSPDRHWINCHCNGGVFNLGHRNSRVVAAVRGALDRLDIGNHHLVSPYKAELARRLAATTDDQLPGVVFGVSGGEAVDLALKVVRGFTERHGVISAKGGYHGHTGLALATGDDQYREPFGPNLPGFVQVPFDDLAALDAAMDEDTAAVILEPIPATLGMPIASEGYLAEALTICRHRGAKLIIDEVQTGLGRAGRIWCHQLDDIVPDVIVTGKGLSGGIYPITATLLSAELKTFLDAHPFAHISTFGGSELGCVAALEVLDIIEAPSFLPRVEEVSNRLAEALSPCRFELRRRGLMMGFKFDIAGAGMMAAKVMLNAGIFAVYANNDTSVLQFLPPLTITDDELEELQARVVGSFS